MLFVIDVFGSNIFASNAGSMPLPRLGKFSPGFFVSLNLNQIENIYLAHAKISNHHLLFICAILPSLRGRFNGANFTEKQRDKCLRELL